MAAVIETKKRGLVTELWINREANLNSLDYDVLRGMREEIRKLRLAVANPGGYGECRAVLIRGKGRAFVAGADLKVMHQCSWEEVAQFIRLGQALMRDIDSLPLPTCAVVDGFALGGGLEIALACDLILVTERALIGQPEVKLGVIPGFGGSQRLAHRVGVGAAKRLIFTGENISGEEAFKLGIADFFVQSSSLESELDAICAKLSSAGPLAIAAAKRCIWKGIETNTLAGLTKEVDEFLEVFNTDDAREGLSAFVEKRTPRFQGK